MTLRLAFQPTGSKDRCLCGREIAITLDDGRITWREDCQWSTEVGEAIMMAPITKTTRWSEMAGFPYVGREAMIAGVFARIGAGGMASAIG
jgi:hypothetical protein